MHNSFIKKTKKGCPLSSLQHAVKRKRKMALDSDNSENSEFYCTIEDFSLTTAKANKLVLGFLVITRQPL